MIYSRVCPRCDNLHNTSAKSSKALCEKCKELKKPETRKKMEIYYESRRKVI